MERAEEMVYQASQTTNFWSASLVQSTLLTLCRQGLIVDDHSQFGLFEIGIFFLYHQEKKKSTLSITAFNKGGDLIVKYVEVVLHTRTESNAVLVNNLATIERRQWFAASVLNFNL